MRKQLTLAVALVALTATFASGCKHKSPNIVYAPDMHYSPAIKAQEEGSSRMPPQGTIPRNYQPYPMEFRTSADGPGDRLRNPLSPTKDVLARGQYVFQTYCMVCHGPAGEGDGSVVPKMPRPPSLQSDKIRGWPDGNIYHVITMGQNIMPSYAAQIPPADRWSAIHYIRALQRSKNPLSSD